MFSPTSFVPPSQNMYPAVCWVPRGASKAVPDKLEITSEEIELLKKQSFKDQDQINEIDEEEDEDEDGNDEENIESQWRKDKKTKSSDDIEIDENEDGEEADGKKKKKKRKAGHRGGGKVNLNFDTMFDGYEDDDPEGLEEFGLKGLSNDLRVDDPFMSFNEDEELEMEELEDIMIKESDLILLAAKTEEDDFSTLEAFLYEDEAENRYVHHDFMLSTFPLCLEWLDFNPINSGKGSFVAIGTFEPEIEIWNLDVIDPVGPVASLGGHDIVIAATKKKGIISQKKKKVKVLRDGSHTDSVLSLSWNKFQRNILASGSADCTAKLWDISTETALHTFTHHADKIQCIEWNPQEASVILTGSFDRSVSAIDVRTPTAIATWKTGIDSDVESLCWNPHNPSQFLVGTEGGNVLCYDGMKPGSDPMWRLDAHSPKGATCISYNPAAPTLLTTASVDKKLKFWEIDPATGPKLLYIHSMEKTKIFSMQYNKDMPKLLALGTKKDAHILDITQFTAIKNQFAAELLC
eukprot:TRINITY_DN2153_c0_g1_i1.p1 TRINITY_DN2153_c0_g1~~TRINITY_DN2153_c0_g1_i1.p1  ORF type:complete len:521 (-),score=268.54 TRINITY_DN2153_c0_g1_i1:93-1655(-)